MKSRAVDFQRSPSKHYKAAIAGEEVVIYHDAYKEKRFRLIAEDKFTYKKCGVNQYERI